MVRVNQTENIYPTTNSSLQFLFFGAHSRLGKHSGGTEVELLSLMCENFTDKFAKINERIREYE